MATYELSSHFLKLESGSRGSLNSERTSEFTQWKFNNIAQLPIRKSLLSFVNKSLLPAKHFPHS
jgi:hypothetical protein